MIWSEPSNQIQPNNTHEQCVKIVSCSSTGCLIGILVPGVPNHYNGSPIPIFYINHPEMLFLLSTYLKRQRRCFTKKHNSKSNSFILSASQWRESHFKNSWTISYISISQHRNIESTIVAPKKYPQIQIQKNNHGLFVHCSNPFKLWESQTKESLEAVRPLQDLKIDQKRRWFIYIVCIYSLELFVWNQHVQNFQEFLVEKFFFWLLSGKYPKPPFNHEALVKMANLHLTS